MSILEQYDCNEDQLDDLFMDLDRTFECSVEFIDFVQKKLVLFHGNAAVERSFSFNNNFLVKNLSERNSVPQRSVHDFIINNNNDIRNIVITKEILPAFKNSSANQVEDLKKQKEIESNDKKGKQAIEAEVHELTLEKEEH